MPQDDIGALFAQTLVEHYDDDLPWKAVHKLRSIGTNEVFDRAAEWCGSANNLQRARGADILAQIGWNAAPAIAKFYRDRAFGIIVRLLEGENEIQPMTSALYALGHIRHPDAMPAIVGFAPHPDCNVRYAVACALGSYADDPIAIKALIVLMKDDDNETRDWATFGLGAQGDADNDQIREALAERLIDEDPDVHFEAVIGLGRRRDRRVVGHLKSILHDDPENSAGLEAAAMLLGLEEDANVEASWLLGALQRLQCWGR